jgi:hypothetical protein
MVAVTLIFLSGVGIGATITDRIMTIDEDAEDIDDEV